MVLSVPLCLCRCVVASVCLVVACSLVRAPLCDCLQHSAGAVTVECSISDTTVALGTSVAQMQLDTMELARIASAGFSIGGQACGNLTTAGVPKASTDGIEGIVTITAVPDDSTVRFTSSASTFYALVVQADNGVFVEADIAGTSGIMYLDGDLDDSSSEDSANRVYWDAERSITSAMLMTLEATTGQLLREGKLEMVAGAGMIVLDDLSTVTTGTLLEMHADSDNSGDGTLTIVSGKTIDSNDGAMILTAWDVDLSGQLDAGADSVTIHTSLPGQTLGVGITTKDMHVANTELDSVFAAVGLTLGSSVMGSVTVDGVDEASSDSFGRLTLAATRDGSVVTFENSASSFNKGISVQGMQGITINENLTTKESESIFNSGVCWRGRLRVTWLPGVTCINLACRCTLQHILRHD